MAAAGERLPYSLQRAKTADIPTQSVDFMVLQFSCIDSSVLPSLGKHHKESRWLIAAGLDDTRLELELSIDKSIARSPEVGIKFNGTTVYPKPEVHGNKERAKLLEDFVYQLPFRGTARGLKEEGRFEVRPTQLCAERWYPATLLEQRGETFAANVMIPDGPRGIKTVVYDEVRPENIRLASGAKQKMELVAKKTLLMVVPQEDPRHATLTVEGSGLITHLFARPTPPPKLGKGDTGKVAARSTPAKVTFRVAEDSKKVTSSVGRETLSHFFNREARKIEQLHEKLKHSWTFQLGPFAEHCVQLEKRYPASKVNTLTVDGTVLAESNAEDLECPEGWWVCQFRFLGEQDVEWDVAECDEHGKMLDSRGIVKHSKKCEHECEIYCKEEHKGFSQVGLRVDGREFKDLAQARLVLPEEPFVMQPQALKATYGLEAPRKCRHTDLPEAGAKKDKKEDKAPSMFGFESIFRCCGCDRTQLEQHDLSVRPRR